MAFDESIAQRMRGAIGGRPGLSEKRMMGGICFLLNGNMIGGVDRAKGGPDRFMFRTGKDNAAAAALPGGEPMVMGERLMRGFYFVEAASCGDELLQRWVDISLAYAGSLPAK